MPTAKQNTDAIRRQDLAAMQQELRTVEPLLRKLRTIVADLEDRHVNLTEQILALGGGE